MGSGHRDDSIREGCGRFLEGSHGDRVYVGNDVRDHHAVTPLCGTPLVIHYGKRRFILDQGLGNETLTRIRDLLRGGASDIVAVAHKDGLSWLVIGPGVPLTIDEIAPEEDQSDHKALKQLGLA